MVRSVETEGDASGGKGLFESVAEVGPVIGATGSVGAVVLWDEGGPELIE